MARKASRSCICVSRTRTPLFANSASMAWSDRGRMAALVRVNRMAVGIVFPADFSMLRIRRMAFTASVASSRLPCVGTMTRSARLIA